MYSLFADAVRTTQRIEDVEKLITALDGANDSIALTLVMSPSKFRSDEMKSVLVTLKEKGLLRLIAIDEIHKIVRDREYREGFKEVGVVLGEVRAGGSDLVVLAMTATLDDQIKDKFCAMTRLTYDSEIWNAKSLGRVKLSRFYRSQTTPLIQKLLKKSLTGDNRRKVIIYCLQQTRAEHTLVRTVERVLQSLDLNPYAVESFHGRRARRMKQFLRIDGRHWIWFGC